MTSFDLSTHKFNEPKNSKIKTIGIVIIIVCSVAFLILFTNLLPFLQKFILGLMGLFAYPFFIVAFSVGIALINNKRYLMTKKYIFYLSLIILGVLALLNLIILGKPDVSFFEYLSLSYEQKYTGGGLIVALIIAPFLYTLGLAGTIIIFSVILVIAIALVVDFLNTVKNYGKQTLKKNNNKNKEIKLMEILDIKKEPQKESLNKKQQKEMSIKNNFNLFLDKKMEEQRNINIEAKRKLGLIEGNLDSEKAPQKAKTIREILLTPPAVDLKSLSNSYISNSYNRKSREQEIHNNFQALKQDNAISEQPNLTEFKNFEENNSFQGQTVFNSEKPKRTFAQLQIDGIKDERPQPSRNIYRRPPDYSRPPLDLLENRPVDLTSLNEDVVGKRIQLERVLETFGINARVIGVVIGPSVTRFELEMPPGISVKKIVAHKDDISLALASRAGLRIEAPIPGKSAVGIELPNDNISTVSIREIIDSDEFLSSKSPINFALGKDINGEVKICNLAKMPHLLVAGATNSGKSIFLNSLILSLIYKSSPDEVRLILVDPKRVEFSMYNELPHLVIPYVITETEKASNALTWAINEMERRYENFATHRCRNLEEYNQLPSVISGEEGKLPYIVIVIDEFNDLMSIMKKEIEEKVKRLAQKARASGIHLVLTTQRPSVDVITGTIKTNFPSRISFALTSFADSKTILDQSGAENLLGKGDMLFLASDANFPTRIQGCYVSNQEVNDVVAYIKENNKKVYDEEAEKEIENPYQESSMLEEDEPDQKLTPLEIKCLKFAIENGQASISSLQRNFAIGFGRAGRIIDKLSKLGYISKQDGMKPREVYLTMEGFENLFGEEEI
jgi:S-DNA-T family DNA segregation ATPase FtsK/SpoIIIE